MKKRMLALLLIAVLLLAACGGGAPAPSPSPEPTPVAPTEPTEPTEPAEADIDWPATIEFVVPANPGGDTDFNARTLAQELSQRLPSNFIVTNMPGGGGSIAGRHVFDSPADGTSALFWHTGFLTSYHVGVLDFGIDEFAFGGIVGHAPGQALIIRADLGINTLEELFAYADENPGSLSIGIEFGAFSFVVATLLIQEGLQVNLVEAGPAADRVSNMLGGHLDMTMVGLGLVGDHLREGNFVALGLDGGVDVTLEGVPTVLAYSNQGIDLVLPQLYFYAFPPGTDAALIEAINAELVDIIFNNPEYAELINTTFFQEPAFFPSAEGLAMLMEISALIGSIDFN